MSSRPAVLAAFLLLLPAASASAQAQAQGQASNQGSNQASTGDERTAAAHAERVERAERAEREREEQKPITPVQTSGARISLLFQGGFLGKMHLSTDAENPGKYDFSFGFLARIDTPVTRWLVAGGEAGFSRTATADMGGMPRSAYLNSDGDEIGPRDTYADLGSSWKFRYPIQLDGGTYLEPYIRIPLGMTLYAQSSLWTAMSGGGGFYTGGFGGMSIFVSPRVAFDGEIGWQHRFTWQQYGAAGARDRIFANGGQLTFHVGLTIRL